MGILSFYKTIILTIIIITLSLIRPDDITDIPLTLFPFSDKVAHFLMYAGLTFFLLVEGQKKLKLNFNKLLLLLVYPLILGISLEFFQLLTPYRSFDILDMIFNGMGLLFGLAVFSAWKYVKALSSASLP